MPSMASMAGRVHALGLLHCRGDSLGAVARLVRSFFCEDSATATFGCGDVESACGKNEYKDNIDFFGGSRLAQRLICITT